MRHILRSSRGPLSGAVWLGLLSSLLLIFVGQTRLQAQTIRYVRPDDGRTSKDGTSWATAYDQNQLQTAINALGAQQVWVAAGTYKPGGNANTDRNISFSLKNGVAVYGGFVGTEASLSERVLGQPNAARPASSTLSGDISQVGVATDNSQAVISNSGLNNTAELDGFVIMGGYTANNGGGIYNTGSSPQLRNLLVTDNTAVNGGGISNSSSNPRLTNCTLNGNSASSIGGGIFNYNSSPSLINCTLSGNSASAYGGGIFNDHSNPTLTNCKLNGNSASSDGGGIFNTDSNPSLTNCTLSGNSAFYYGGALFNYNSNPTLTNGIVFNNGDSNTFGNDYSSVRASYCLIDSGVTGYISGSGNLTATSSPFVSATNLQLKAGSATIDAGNNQAYTTAGGGMPLSPPTDLAGNPRIANSTIDMGAYEFQGPFCQPVAITQQPASGSSVCVGSTVTAMISLTSSSPAYQWYKDNLNNPISGQTSATLTLTNVQTSQAGRYQLVVTGQCNSLTSTAFSLTVNALPSVSITPSATVICAGQSAQLMTSGANSYTWSTQQTTPTISASVTGSYSVTGTASNGCSGTATANVTINLPTVSLSNNGPFTCAQTSVTLTASSATTGLMYSFSPGATQKSPPNTATVSTVGSFTLTATRPDNGCSAKVTTTVFGANSVTVCRGANATLSLLAAGSPTRYEWYAVVPTGLPLLNLPLLYQGTSTANLTVLNALVSTMYYARVYYADGHSVLYGPFRVSVDYGCRGRVAATTEPGAGLSIRLLGNPLVGEQLWAVVHGVEGQSLQVRLLDMQGDQVRQQVWEMAAEEQSVTWDVSGWGSGVYVLEAVSGQQRQGVKVVKP